MADEPFNEDAALRYVLDELNPAERREFESRLATSTELRALIVELEAGVVAAASASPRRRPPAKVWRRIEKAVARESRPKLAFPAFGFGWLRNGWGATAACLMGWLFYAFFMNRHDAVQLAPLKNSPAEIVMVIAAKPVIKPGAAKPGATAITNTALELLQARTQEIMALRGKIGQLETARNQLTQLVARQHALLSETNRIKFYHLTTASPTGGNGNLAPLSPGLQHAVQMALARELGWLPAESSPAPQAGDNSTPKLVTIGGVDFVDFHPASQTSASPTPATPTADNTAANTAVQPRAQAQAESPATSPNTPAADPTIPAFVSGDKLVVAVDSTTMPMGSLVTLTATDGGQNQTGGSFILGENPTVATMFFGSPVFAPAGSALDVFSAGGVSWAYVTMNYQTPDGLTGSIQFYAPPATNP